MPVEKPFVRRGRAVLGSFIDALTWEEASRRILGWAARRESRFVCLCNVHSVVTALRDPRFRHVLTAADMNAPDGAPVAWALRRLGMPGQQRISGPDLMWRLLGDAERRQLRVYFYGSSEATLDGLERAVRAAFPRLRIAGLHAPPYRPLSPPEQKAAVDAINSAGTHLLFVGLGCPKQETWMFHRRGEVKAVMLGVGAAFDFHAGVVRRAPPWMQEHGLEWLHRLCADPRRLLPRYVVTNSIFMLRFLQQWLRQRKTDA